MASAQTPVTRTVYVSAVDREGSPVTDMQAADFEVKEGGKLQEISVKRREKRTLLVGVGKAVEKFWLCSFRLRRQSAYHQERNVGKNIPGVQSVGPQGYPPDPETQG